MIKLMLAVLGQYCCIPASVTAVCMRGCWWQGQLCVCCTSQLLSSSQHKVSVGPLADTHTHTDTPIHQPKGVQAWRQEQGSSSTQRWTWQLWVNQYIRLIVLMFRTTSKLLVCQQWDGYNFTFICCTLLPLLTVAICQCWNRKHSGQRN